MSKAPAMKAARGWIAVAVSVIGLVAALVTLQMNIAAINADAAARKVATASAFRSDLIGAARDMEDARSKGDGEGYRFEWHRMVDGVEAHLEDAEVLGLLPHHQSHDRLLVNTLSVLRENCERAGGTKGICAFDGHPLSACLVEQGSTAACVEVSGQASSVTVSTGLMFRVSLAVGLLLNILGVLAQVRRWFDKSCCPSGGGLFLLVAGFVVQLAAWWVVF